MLLIGENIKKEYGIQTVIDIKKIEIAEYDRIGIVGKNGAGKSTLLSILRGEIPCDEGVIKRNGEIASILQSAEVTGEADARLMSQMQLKDSAIKSGGERTRLAIAVAFSKHAPLLFADEPTTNLDTEGILSLEKMLTSYHGAVVLISHDRELLDHVCNQIWEIEEGKLRVFSGNYSEWREQRKRERDFSQFEHDKYTKEKKRLEHSIRNTKQKAKNMKKPPRKMGSSEWLLYKGIASEQQGHVQKGAGALKSRLEQLEKKEAPKDIPKVSMKLPEQNKMSAKVTAKIEGLSVRYGEKLILDEISLSVLSGKKTFLIGKNGAGKTTIIKELLEQFKHAFITSEAKIGYFSQAQENLNLEKSVLENVRESACMPEHICRAVLMNLYMKWYNKVVTRTLKKIGIIL